jgi:hypothetical protein
LAALLTKLRKALRQSADPVRAPAMQSYILSALSRREALKNIG